MKLLAFAVLDEKTEAFLPPFFVVAPGQAVRLFTDGCQDRESPLGKHPGDYKLYRVGSFDDNSGEVVGELPVFMCSGAEAVGQQLKAV